MATLDKKKIDGVLKQLENAAKAAVKVLNNATDNSLVDSPYAEFPLESIGMISNLLRKVATEAEISAAYAGLTEEQIAEKKAEEAAAELAELQANTQAKLAELLTPAEVIEEVVEAEPTGTEVGDL